MDVTGNITAKLCEVWSEFNIFCTFVTMATATILNLFNPPKAATHYGGYFYKVSWSLMKGIQHFFNSPLFCFHDNCGKVCPSDSDFFLAYLVPIDVDVVPIKFHQFLFGEYPAMIIFVFLIFFSILVVSMATAAILKKSTLNSTTSHGIWYSYKVS